MRRKRDRTRDEIEISHFAPRAAAVPRIGGRHHRPCHRDRHHRDHQHARSHGARPCARRPPPITPILSGVQQEAAAEGETEGETDGARVREEQQQDGREGHATPRCAPGGARRQPAQHAQPVGSHNHGILEHKKVSEDDQQPM